jgi:hypothetical protein
MDKFFKWEPIVIAIGMCVFILVLFSFSNCTPYIETSTEYKVPVIHSESEAIYWIDHHISYKSDTVLYGYADYWASPDETLANSAGDCEDVAILFLVMVYENLGEKGVLDIVTKKTVNTVRAHAYGSVNGYNYYLASGYDTLYSRYTYDGALSQIGRSSRGIQKSNDLVVGGDDDQR